MSLLLYTFEQTWQIEVPFMEETINSCSGRGFS